MFYQSIILFLFGHHDPSSFSDARQISVSAATEICTIYRYLRNARFDKRPVCMVSHIILSAALVFLRENPAHGGGLTGPDDGVDNSYRPVASPFALNLEQCVVALREMASTWELAGQTLRVIASRAATGELPPRLCRMLFPVSNTPVAPLTTTTITVSAAAQQSLAALGLPCDISGLAANTAVSPPPPPPSERVDCGDASVRPGVLGSLGGDVAAINDATTIEDILKEVGGDMNMELDLWGTTAGLGGPSLGGGSLPG
jgi:hypothetical protein